MPNHVSHILVAVGPAASIARLLSEEFLSIDGDVDRQCLDFNKLIPMPEELNITDGSDTSLGLAITEATGAAKAHCDRKLKDYRSYPWAVAAGITTREDLLAYAKDKCPTAIAAGRQAADNINKHGCATWYDWSIKNWGTKWNSYSFTIVRQAEEFCELRFDTAWSPPEPVLRELSKRLPDLVLHVCCYDEGGGFALSGVFAAGNGSLADHDCGVEGRGIYAAVYGGLPADAEEEDEDEEPAAAAG
jgi:hypothetical protein